MCVFCQKIRYKKDHDSVLNDYGKLVKRLNVYGPQWLHLVEDSVQQVLRTRIEQLAENSALPETDPLSASVNGKTFTESLPRFFDKCRIRYVCHVYIHTI